MTASHIEHVDLDNLAKPILDTLFHPRHPQVKDMSLIGALFDVDDDRIFKLNLEKRLVTPDTEEGIDVTIAW